MRLSLVLALGLLLCAAPVLSAFDGTAPAPVPCRLSVEYRVHETPGDAQSRVAFTILLHLEQQSISGSQVGWHAGAIEFRRKGLAGAADTVWVAYDVEAATPDGLWRVTHADVSAPAAEDFVLPPRYWGVAAPVVSTDLELEFDIRGRTFTPPETGAPYAVTAGMDYDVHTAVGPEIPPETDQPVEVPPVNDPERG